MLTEVRIFQNLQGNQIIKGQTNISAIFEENAFYSFE